MKRAPRGAAPSADLYHHVMVQTAWELATTLAEAIESGRPGPGERMPSLRELARAEGCAPGTAVRAYAQLRDAGIIGRRDRSRSVVTPQGPARARAWRAATPALRLAGSDDPALDLLLRLVGDRVAPAPGARGSVNGLTQLARGDADGATIHLLHAGSGRHNDPFVRRVLAGEPVVVVHLWRREQGLVLPRGNPLGIRGVADLAGRRLAWRGPGTGSRLLLQRLLREAGLRPRPDLGEPSDSHLAVATAVATGAADAGLAVRAAAEAADADWIPVTVEPFELALRADALAAAGPLLDALAASATQPLLGALPGYDLTDAGRSRRPA